MTRIEGIDNIMGWKPRFFATINACAYAASIDTIKCPNCHHTIITFLTNNHGEMDITSARQDQANLDEKVRKYLKKLNGLQITIPISDIAQDLNLTEECVVRILKTWQMILEEEDENA